MQQSEEQRPNFPDKDVLIYGHFIGGSKEANKTQIFEKDIISRPTTVGAIYHFSEYNKNIVPYHTWYGSDRTDNDQKLHDIKTIPLGRFKLINNLEQAMLGTFNHYIRSHRDDDPWPDTNINTFLIYKDDIQLKKNIINQYAIPLHRLAEEDIDVANTFHQKIEQLTLPDYQLNHLVQMSSTLINNGSDETIEKSFMHLEAYIAMKNEDYENAAEINKFINCLI